MKELFWKSELLPAKICSSADISVRCKRDPYTNEIKSVKVRRMQKSTGLLADYDLSVPMDTDFDSCVHGCAVSNLTAERNKLADIH